MTLPPVISAAMVGLVSGFVFAIPVGPVNVTVVNEGARRGFLWAALIGLGATAMDLIYCAAAFASFSALFDAGWIRAAIELVSFFVMIWLGLKLLRATHLPETSKSLEAVEHRLHPHTAFARGFVRVLGNPAIFLFWVAMSANYIAQEWIADNWPSKAAFIFGAACGAAGWFLLLSFLVSLGHGRFSQRSLVRLSHISGACLLGLALIIAVKLVYSIVAGPDS